MMKILLIWIGLALLYAFVWAISPRFRSWWLAKANRK